MNPCALVRIVDVRVSPSAKNLDVILTDPGHLQGVSICNAGF